jgi:hypothetical protein
MSMGTLTVDADPHVSLEEKAKIVHVENRDSLRLWGGPADLALLERSGGSKREKQEIEDDMVEKKAKFFADMGKLEDLKLKEKEMEELEKKILRTDSVKSASQYPEQISGWCSSKGGD